MAGAISRRIKRVDAVCPSPAEIPRGRRRSDDKLRMAVPVQVGKSRLRPAARVQAVKKAVISRPLRERGSGGGSSVLPVIQGAVRVARHQIHVAVPVQVGESRGRVAADVDAVDGILRSRPRGERGSGGGSSVLPVIQGAVRVARHQIHVAVPVQVGESRGRTPCA